MTEPLAFLSFDSEHDGELCKQFLEQLNDCPVLFKVEDSSTDMTAPGSDREKSIAGKIGRCNLMVVLIGADTGNSPSVRRDIRLARQANVPYFGVQTPQASPSTSLPEELPPRRVTEWDWKRIGDAVTQLMGEGKHHRFK